MANPKIMPEKIGHKTKTYQAFLNEDLDLRLKQEQTLYLKQLNFLKENHEKRIDYLKKVTELKNKLQFGNPKKNNQIEQEIKKLKISFSGDSEKRRKTFFNETMKPQISKFQNLMEKRKKNLAMRLKPNP